MKVDWHYLCVEMMMDYIPQELETREEFNKFQEICDHFINVSKTLGEKIKSEQNKSVLTPEDNEDIANIMQLMKRLARQNLEFLKKWAVEKGVFTQNRKVRYEK